MVEFGPQFGLVLLGLVALLVATTGQPVFVVLLFASALGAGVGVAAGVVPVALLGALPPRLIGLLEQDLLQAVPLFVFIGALLNHLPLADLLYRFGCRLGGGSPAASRVAAVGLSALLAPMNGSVGASVLMLSRVVAPRLRERGAGPADVTALVAVASTLGVLVPPSVVLLLLGDAMMRAHTEALTLSGRSERILNTQDLLHGAWGPAALTVLAVGGVAAWQARKAPPSVVPEARLTRGEAVAAVIAVATLALLLGGVAVGRLYAVEAAATAGVLLLAGAACSGRLQAAAFSAALRDGLDVTGSLFALFVSATTFTLVLRALGTDVLVAKCFAQLPPGTAPAAAAALAVLLLCALVFDAFELILVVVPIVMPPVLARVDDPVWMAVASLLVLQLSFALPPLGYAVMMSGMRITPHPPMRELMKRLAPYLAALAGVFALVLWQPRLVHLGDTAPAATIPKLSPDEVDRLMREAAPGG